MSERVLKFKNFLGQEVEAIPKLFLYDVSDFMGKRMTIIGIQLYTMEDGMLEPYATLTKSFGEFIGAKNCAYIDTNNYSFAPQILETGVAKDTGFTKESGYCTYPLWCFDEKFLKDIGGEKYQKYSEQYDAYMSAFNEGEDEDEGTD